MIKLSDYVHDLDVPVDGTYRGDCPQCGGKNTFTATNDSGNLLYNCYKAGCRTAGVVHTSLDPFTIQAKLSDSGNDIADDFATAMSKTFELPPYMVRVDASIKPAMQFVRKWGIVADHVLYDVRQDRVVFPVYHGNVPVDAVGRALTNRKPKWLRYASSPIPYVHGTGNTCVLVEDAISAYVVGKNFEGAVGVALLGTQLTDFHKWFFAKYHKNDRVIVALDPDALDKTMSIVHELSAKIADVKAFSLVDDIKYMRTHDSENLSEVLYA